MNREFWYTLWGVGIAFAIQMIYEGLNQFPNLSRGFWSGLVINGFILAILILARAKKHTTEGDEQKEEEKDKDEDEEKPNMESIIAEYRVLKEATQRRGSDTLLVDSIMIPSSIAILIFAVRSRTELGTSNLFDLPVAGFIPLLALLLVIIPYAFHWTTNILDSKYFDRLREIEEKELKIKGQHYIHDKIKCEPWYLFRRSMWHFFFLLLIGLYLFTSCWLFTKL